jgi:DNA-binding transcriptional LysR family regulator
VIDNLPNLVAFAQIVSTGSLSAASRELDLSLPVISKRLAHLEKSLGVRLVQRTTRRLTLTEEGELFHGQVLRILAEIEEAESLISDRRDVVSGMLRVTAPHAFGRGRIAPIIAEFAKCHEELSVNLELNDSVVDLLETGIDLAIRFGSLSDSSMIARELAPNFRVLCASPAYVEKHGQPKDPADLFRHRCIVIGKQQRTEWRFEGVDNPVVRVKGAFVTNDGDAAHVWKAWGSC